MPPIPGYLKLNFDAAYRDGTTITGVILRDSSGDIKGAWVHRFESMNAFCAETEVANQALHIATTLNLSKVIIEGDATTVVMALNGIDDYTDWRVTHLSIDGRSTLSQHCLWQLQYAPRECNRSAHNLAQWAKTTDFCGRIESPLLPLVVWCDRGGT